MDPVSLLVLSVVWVAASSGSGFLLSSIAKRVHPGLSFRKLWGFYTVLMATLVAVVFLVIWL